VLDADDKPHIAYLAETGNGSGQVRYAYKDASGWHFQVVADSVWVYSYASLAIGADGYPHIIHNGGLYLYHAYQDASGWNTEIVDFEDGAGEYPSLALDAAGYPHVSYFDSDSYSGDADLRYAYQDASGWHVQVVDSAGLVGYSTSLALDASGCAYISYFDKDNNQVKVAQQENCAGGTTWQFQTIDRMYVDVGYTSLVLDGSGYLHVGFIGGNDSSLKYAYQDAGGWHTLTPAAGLNNSSFASLALDGSGAAHIAYQTYATDGSSLLYTRLNGASWEETLVDHGSLISVASELAQDGQGRLHVAYFNPARAGLSYAS
jgi:hypothetical protein